MRKETDLDAVKLIAKSFVHLPIEPTEFGPAIIVHPIYSSAYTMDKNGKIVNILEDSDELKKLNELYCKKIDRVSSYETLLAIIRDGFWLTFFKFTKDYLSKKEFSKILGDIWTGSENPNADKNVPIRSSASYFKKADKKILMNDAEYKVYSELPEFIEVYRGVSPGRERNGLSWTANKKKAVWFANRFSTNQTKGYLLYGTVSKKDVLAYFNRRNEDELVIHPNNIINMREETV